MFQDGYHYLIRSSYREGECWKSRDLLDLGTDPADHIEYVGGNGFYFNPEVEEKLHAQGARFSSDELEALFMPFLPPHIRYTIESFQTHAALRTTQGAWSAQELAQRQRSLHSFDKRRLHFLRCGRVDIGDLEQRPWKFLKVLMEKSRDEIEHVIEGMEGVLRPHERRTYLFTALHLQDRFPHHWLRNNPAALDQEAVDDHFIAALCSLNSDATYFAGMDHPDRSTLHPYLVKYLVLYFDSEFEGGFWPEQLRDFVVRQQFSRRRITIHRIALEEACKLFGICTENLASMSRSQLVRLYRRKAKELHPDRGGDQEAFIRMTEAFACLMDGK